MTFARLLTSTVALAALVSVSQAADLPMKAPRMAAPAIQQASGYVEVYGGWARTSFDATFCELSDCISESERINGWVLGGAGRGNYWISPNMSVQFDAQAEGTSYKDQLGPYEQHFSNHSYLIGGHLNWRNPERGLFGIFAGAGDAGGGFSPAQRHVVAGAEAQLYWNQFTFYFQGGYDTTVGTSFAEADAWFLRGTGRYFFTPNTLLEGTVLYADGELDFGNGPLVLGPSSQDFSTLLWEAKLEHRFGATPFSGFLKYRGSRTEYDNIAFAGFSSEQEVKDHRFMVGLRLYMGQNTLLTNDRAGATLDIIDPLSIQSGPLMSGFGGPGLVAVTVD